MAKKGQTLQLQTELNTDEEWEKYLEKPGLLVIDIYSDWCGPCAAMQATLKKIKVEYGGDTLQLAIAKCDTINALERFRGKSEPTWMFVSNGKMVNFVYGANAPLLTKIINEELRIQKQFEEGSYVRTEVLEVTDRAPAEAERWQVVQEELAAEEALERAKKAEEVHMRLTKESDAILENLGNLGVIVIFPHARDKYNEVLKDSLNEAGLVISLSEKMKITPEQIQSISYFCKEGQDMYLPEKSLEHLFTGDCQVLVVKAGHGKPEMEEPISVQILDVIYGPTRAPPGERKCPYRKLMLWPNKEQKQKEMFSSELVLASVDQLMRPQDSSIPSVLVQQPSLSAHIAESREPSLIEEQSIFEEEDDDFIIGIWAPPTRRILSSCFKTLFSLMAGPLLIPEPPPKPPFIAVCFNIDRRAKVQSLMSQWESEIERYGIFTSVNPDEAELVAKSFRKYDHLDTKDGNEKIVIQLARKRSECLLNFSSEIPNYMSPNVRVGKKDLKKFFPEGYDEQKDAEEDEEFDEILEEFIEDELLEEEEILEEETDEEDEEWEAGEDWEEGAAMTLTEDSVLPIEGGEADAISETFSTNIAITETVHSAPGSQVSSKRPSIVSAVEEAKPSEAVEKKQPD